MAEGLGHICFNLGKVLRRIQAYYQQCLAPFGLTVSQFFVLGALYDRDGVSFSELSERVAVDASTLTGIIDRMERNGFVERRPDPEDRRVVRIFLTPKAKEVATQVMPFADRLDANIRKLFPREQMEVFEAVLAKLAEVPDLGEGETSS